MSNQVTPPSTFPEDTVEGEKGQQDPAGLAHTDELPADPDAVADEILFGFSAGDRRFLLVSCLIILGLVVANLIRLNWLGPPQLVLDRATLYQVEINDAGWVEWMQLPGIGETTARNIVADREKNGPFKSIEDVMRVKGIGPATFKSIRPCLRFEMPQDARQ